MHWPTCIFWANLTPSSLKFAVSAAPSFEAGYAALTEFGLCFDLQCAPAQLDAAAALLARHPSIPVCVDRK